ncbi:DUF7856 family protein [Halostella litorea]|uniref:DUF7856 family protein n=1 Tax=Halostella litorea TaxID=2528831 RepID=UPI0010928274|nr:hypothetical protein [Halostella litorea]
MRVELADEVREGRAVALRDRDVSPETVAAAVREGEWIDCPEPGAVHERVSPVTADASPSVRPALAAAARSRGLTSPVDDALADARAELAAIDPPPIDHEAARKRVAEAGEREAALDERVAELRGRIDALAGRDGEPGDATDERAAAIRELSEVRTERVAAEQALRDAREAARAARDARDRRLRLEDRVRNLRSAAREHLSAAVAEPFADAVAAVPGEGRVADEPAGFEGDPVTAALAVVRVAAVDAPVVLACDRFDSAAAAADTLDAPVLTV